MKNWDAVIGLEVHVQLKTKTKLFSSDSAEFGRGDNESVHPVSLGLPGTLPVLNENVQLMATKLALALKTTINPKSQFSRKNYFYPDMPKGYQISQLEKPFCTQGKVSFFVDGQKIDVRIQKAHIEEDAGKLTHHGEYSLVNYNRAGVPLMEVVTEPDMSTPMQAAECVRMIRRVVRYIDVCDGNLEEGSLRCDCNVSVKPKGEKKLGTKVEIKNINSFRFIEKAVEYEIQRQIDVLETGGSLVQETRLYDPVKNRTQSMRKKEDAQDYRYFPEPDLPQFNLDTAWLEKMKQQMPELPVEKVERLISAYSLSEYDAWGVADERAFADYFEAGCKAGAQPKQMANWMLTDLRARLNESNVDIEHSRIPALELAALVKSVQDGKISGKIAKDAFKKMWDEHKPFSQLEKEMDLSQVTDTSEIEKIISEVLQANTAQVEEYKLGKQKVYGFFVGEIMKRTKGRANPAVVNDILGRKLKS